MKGLLLKDWYMMQKYCRTYCIIAVGFIVMSLLNNESLFFMFYPCMLCGMIPVSLLGYDERSKWTLYSMTMPYSKTQIVCGKYLIGLLSLAVLITVTGIAQAAKMLIDGTFVLPEFLVLMSLLVIVSLVASSIPLPFMFKWGVEKGRIAYYVMIGLVCCASAVSANIFKEDLQMEIQPGILLLVVAAAAIGIYSLSWYLSVVFYNKREIQ